MLMLLLQSCKEFNKSDLENGKKYLESVSGIDYSYLIASQTVSFVLSSMPYYFENIEQLSQLSNSINTRLSNLESFQDINHLMYSLLGIRTGGYGPPIITRNKDLMQFDEDVNTIFQTLNFRLKDTDIEEWNKLPVGFKKHILELYITIEKAEKLLKDFSFPLIHNFKKQNIKIDEELYDVLLKPWNKKELFESEYFQLLKHMDLIKLSYASRIISEKIDPFFKYKESDFENEFSQCIISTNLGEIVINGHSNDSISDDYLFAIDLGGDDVYYGNIAFASPINKLVNIVIDIAGNDIYDSNGFVCSSILGFSSLIDLNGSDEYYSEKPGIASSLFGTSILFDQSGNDSYKSTSENSMGAAIFGTAALVDLDGDDDYNSVSYSQGFAGTNGIGCLYDQKGNDHYNTDKAFYSDKKLPSFVQGTSKGRWAEATDGINLSGGIGILIDGKGTDEFYAYSFAQGASYYFGIGLFFNKIGADRYNSVSHSQGYSAHYALASFIDEEGNDIYNENSFRDKITQIIGSGRDLSIGIFQDFNGDDHYYFGNRSFAVGDMNGIGIMIDYTGDDNYNWIKNNKYIKSASVGQTFTVNSGMQISRVHPTKFYNNGLFIDKVGKNNFNKSKSLKNE